MSFLKITQSFPPSFCTWDLVAYGFQKEQVFLLKKKFEKFTQQLSSEGLFETLQKKEGGECLVRLWKVSGNKYLMWLQDIKKVQNSVKQADLFTSTHRQKLSETLAEFPLLLWHHTEKQNMDYCNETYASMLGKDVKTVLLNKESLFPSSQVASLFQKVKKTGKLQKLRLSKNIEGERHFFDLWEKIDPEGGSWGLGIDISEYEKSKESTKQELKALEKIFNYFLISVSIFTKNQKLTYFNKAFSDLFLLDEQWLSQNPTFEEIFDELRNKRLLPEVVDFSVYKKKFLSFFEEEAHLREETLHLPDERSLRLTIAPYALGGVIMLFEDITERLVLERKNNTMVAVQNALANHLQEGVFIFGVDHRLTLMNAFCAQLWGVESHFSEGEYLNQLLHKTKDLFDYGKNWSLFKANILTGVANRSPKQGIIHRKDGISLKFHYIPLPSGEHLITYQDVTDSFKFQEIFEEATRLLTTTHFIKNDLLDSMAFGLRDWTEHFTKFSQALGKKVTTFNRLQKQSVFELVRVSENLKKTLYNMLDIVGESSLGQKILPQKLIESTLYLFKDLIKEKNIYISKNIEEKILITISDKKMMYHFLCNLMGYTLQGCPEGDRVHISLNVFKNNIRLSLACRVDISEENLEKLSSWPESMLYRNVEFSLVLIKKLAALCGGDFKVASRNKKRLRIFCDFPYLEGELPGELVRFEEMEETLEDSRQTACG